MLRGFDSPPGSQQPCNFYNKLSFKCHLTINLKKMRKSTRKNWMAKEKIAILNCINEGLKVKAIKRKLFPGDRNIKYNALAKVIERIKKDNQWAYENPSIIFKNTNSSNETKVEKQNPNQRKSPLHFWPVTEKKKIAEAAFVKNGERKQSKKYITQMMKRYQLNLFQL